MRIIKVVSKICGFFGVKKYVVSFVFQKQSKRALFSPKHVIDAVSVTFKKRNGPNRRFVLLTISIFFFQVMPFFGEGAISYLYVQTRYDWAVKEYSTYSTITSIASLIGT